MILDLLFHWSPAARRDAILKEGLVPGSVSATSSVTVRYTCLSPSPSAAWALSGDLDWVEDEDDWDLWQVRLAETDEVRIRSDFGPVVREVRVFNVVPPDRLWWAGRRTPWLTGERR